MYDEIYKIFWFFKQCILYKSLTFFIIRIFVGFLKMLIHFTHVYLFFVFKRKYYCYVIVFLIKY